MEKELGVTQVRIFINANTAVEISASFIATCDRECFVSNLRRNYSQEPTLSVEMEVANISALTSPVSSQLHLRGVSNFALMCIMCMTMSTGSTGQSIDASATTPEKIVMFLVNYVA